MSTFCHPQVVRPGVICYSTAILPIEEAVAHGQVGVHAEDEECHVPAINNRLGAFDAESLTGF